MRAEYISGAFALLVLAGGIWKDFQLRQRTEAFEKRKLESELQQKRAEAEGQAQQAVKGYEYDLLQTAMKTYPEMLMAERARAIEERDRARAEVSALEQQLRDSAQRLRESEQARRDGEDERRRR